MAIIITNDQSGFKLVKQPPPPPPVIQCVNRNDSTHSDALRCVLGEQQKTNPCVSIPSENADDLRYKSYSYNGQFHKGFAHNSVDGRLTNNADYENMRTALLTNNQVLLNSIPICAGGSGKLVNPLASLVTPLVGAPQCSLSMDTPPSMNSDAGAAEMIEVYALALARDEPFVDYTTSSVISTLLGATCLNKPDLLNALKYSPTPNLPFTAQTVFRGNAYGDIIGPYISQLLLLNVPMGALTLVQTYACPKSRAVSTSRVEWGVNATEAINTENTKLSLLPAATSSSDITSVYLFSGRCLAEAVHNDPLCQFPYQGAQLLLGLGASPNPGFPVYANQASFGTGSGGPAIVGCIVEATKLALQHAWWWKWQQSRKLRPEVFGLAIHNVKSSTVANLNNYDISNVALNNDVLVSVEALNNTTYSSPGSYCLPNAFREGSPLHPTYPSGHATVLGAACTMMKIFFDAEQPWTSLPGLQIGSQNRRILPSPLVNVVTANASGSALIDYTGLDIPSMTISGEINKLASNVGMGRNWGSVHYRADGTEGMRLGEQVAIRYMEDILNSCVENNLDGTVPEITFRKFDGTMTTIKPTVC